MKKKKLIYIFYSIFFKYNLHKQANEQTNNKSNMSSNNTQQSTTYFQQSDRDMSDFSDMSYIVYEITSTGRQNTATFLSKSKAFDFVNQFCDVTSAVYIYKTKCIKALSPYCPSTNEMSENNLSMLINASENIEKQSPNCNSTSSSTKKELLFDGLEYTKYGKGYILYPSKLKPFNGELYLLDGWWNGNAHGWFFRSQYVNQLKDNGAIFVTKRGSKSRQLNKKSESDTTTLTTNDNSSLYSSIDLTGLTFSDYGKGYILYPRSNTSFFGQKYLLNGWWNSSLEGWFFKSEFYSQLVSHGATYDNTMSDLSDNEQENSSIVGPSPFSHERDLSAFTIHEYGRGYVVKCSKSNKLFKNQTPYLLGNLGFWNKNANGWFFQKQYLASIKTLGAVFVKSEQAQNKSSRSSSRTSSLRSSRSNGHNTDYVCADTEFY